MFLHGVCDSVHGGGAWSRGVCSWRGVPAPGWVSAPGGGCLVPGGGGAWSKGGGCLLPGGGAWWRPPRRLLLRAVCILLECILVALEFGR